MDRWGQVSHTLIGLRPPEEHWYLAVFGVEPAFQGRGLGARMLEELERLRVDRPAPFYLESDRPESVRFYRAHGFADRDEVTVHGVRCWCLGQGFPDETPDLCDSVRQARPASPNPPRNSGPKGP